MPQERDDFWFRRSRNIDNDKKLAKKRKELEKIRKKAEKIKNKKPGVFSRKYWNNALNDLKKDVKEEQEKAEKQEQEEIKKLREKRDELRGEHNKKTERAQINKEIKQLKRETSRTHQILGEIEDKARSELNKQIEKNKPQILKKPKKKKTKKKKSKNKKPYETFQGRRVYTGKRGGKYILKNRHRVYI